MTSGRLIEGELTHSIIGAFYAVYNTLGFGFLEHLYVAALERELTERGHDVGREVIVRVMYRGEELGTQRLDMVVDGKVAVETKSTYEIHRAAERQLYNYLRATNLEVGLLLHFGPRPQFFRVVCRNRHPFTAGVWCGPERSPVACSPEQPRSAATTESLLGYWK